MRMLVAPVDGTGNARCRHIRQRVNDDDDDDDDDDDRDDDNDDDLDDRCALIVCNFEIKVMHRLFMN